MFKNRDNKQEHDRSRRMVVPDTAGCGEIVTLNQLWGVALKGSRTIFSSLLLCLSIAALYLYFVEPIYRSTTHLLPPKQQDIEGLSVSSRGVFGLDLRRYTPEFVYGVFLHNLKSWGLRREFFDIHRLEKHYISSHTPHGLNADRTFSELFNARFRWRVDRVDPLSVSVSFDDSDPEVAAKWLNQYVAFANKKTVNQLSQDVTAAINERISELNRRIDDKRFLAEKRRLDRITSLKEALNVADKLGIESTNFLFSKKGSGTQAGLAIHTAAMPLYMRGSAALKAEISVLESRKSDEPFIDGLRDLQEQLAFLKGIQLRQNSLSSVTVDWVARPAYKPERPQPLKVLILASALGVLLGIGVVLIFQHDR